MSPATDCWFLTGPTASGKTRLGVELARRIRAEVLSLDSMALYRGMDIGTAKPTTEERAAIPHHLINVIEPQDEYSLAQYIAAAERTIVEIRSRGHEVLFVGGTPLYLKGLLRGIFEGPPADADLRRRLEEEEQRRPGELFRRVQAIDPAAAGRLHPNDIRRLVRAIEVFEKTGRPISGHQRQFEIGRTAQECRVFVLDWPREELYARINRRVDRMFADGLVDEVRALLSRPFPMSKTAGQALGYREVLDHLDGRCGLAEAIDLVKTHTRQFSKRQLTWFRSLSECQFVPMSEATDVAEVVERVLRAT